MSALTSSSEPSDGPLHICPLRLPWDTCVSDIVNVQFAVAPSQGDTSAIFLVPLHLVDGPARADGGGYDRDLNLSSMLQHELTRIKAYLRICVQIPQIEFPRPVSSTEHRGMEGVPLDIVNIIVCLLERVNWRDGRCVRSRHTSGLPAGGACQVRR